MTTRYELIAVEQPGTNVKALHLAYQAFVDKLNNVTEAMENEPPNDMWKLASFGEPHVHVIDNSIVVFATMRRFLLPRGVAEGKPIPWDEPLPFDEPPVLEPEHAMSSGWGGWRESDGIPANVKPLSVVDPPKRKRGRPRKTE